MFKWTVVQKTAEIASLQLDHTDRVRKGHVLFESQRIAIFCYKETYRSAAVEQICWQSRPEQSQIQPPRMAAEIHRPTAHHVQTLLYIEVLSTLFFSV